MIVFFPSLACHGLIFLICELFVVMLIDFLFASVFVPLFVGPLNVVEVRRRFCFLRLLKVRFLFRLHAR